MEAFCLFSDQDSTYRTLSAEQRFSITNYQSQITNLYGGADRDRTGDPLLAKQVLSQLSYSPIILPGVSG